MKHEEFQRFLDYMYDQARKENKVQEIFTQGANERGGETFTVAPPKPTGSRSTHDQWTDDAQTVWWVHRWKPSCVEDGCAIHCPSDHHMLSWPKVMRSDTLIERLCIHDMPHPDPDSLRFFASVGKASFGEHYCDGCCNERFANKEK